MARRTTKTDRTMTGPNKDVVILREVVGKLVELMTNKGLVVTQRGTQAFVSTNPKTLKPERVNIPYIPDNASEDLLMAIQGFVDHEVGHVLDTNWTIPLSIKDNDKLKNLWNIVEDVFVEKCQQKRFAGTAYNLAKLHKFFLERITAPALAKLEIKGDEQKEFRILLVPVVRALSGQTIFKEFLDAGGYWEHPLVKAFVEKIPETVKDRLTKIKSSAESAEIAVVFHDILTPPPKEEEEPEDEPPEEKAPPTKTPSGATGASEEKADDPDGEGAAKDKPEDDEDKGTGGEESDESESEGDETDGEEEPAEDEGDESEAGSDDAEEEESEEEDEGGGTADESSEEDEEEGASDEGDEEGSDEEEVESSVEISDEESSGAPNTDPTSSPFITPIDVTESDSFDGALEDKIGEETVAAMRAEEYSIYSNDFDKIEKLPVDDKKYSDAWLKDLDEKTAHMVGPMQKDIERMMAARSLRQKIPGYRSGKLHGAGLFKLSTGDDRIFRRVHEAQTKETAVILLVDNSGSMGSGANLPGYGYMSKMQIAMASAYALSSTLDRVKIAHEVMGFTTWAHPEFYKTASKELREEQERIGHAFARIEPIYMPIYKGWDERMTPAVRKRFAAAPHTVRMQNNVDGESIITATDRLLRRSEPRRVLIVLSDGSPAFGTPYSGIADRHCKMAVERAESLGVETIGIGILDDSVESFYPKNIVLRDLADLPKAVMGELKSVLVRN
jgi:hypothetical protein